MVQELIDAGVYYGHQTKKWHPKIKPFILDSKNNIHIIDVDKTVVQIEEAGKFLADSIRENKQLLFVGCKRQAYDTIKDVAESVDQHYVNHRWLGGTLTNHSTVLKSVKRLDYLEGIERSPEFKKMSKKEISQLNRERKKLLRSLQGIRYMKNIPDVMIVVDVKKEKIAVAEGKNLGIPIVGIIDTDTDPNIVDYPIIGNDDSINSIKKLLEKLIAPVVESINKLTPQQRAEAALNRS